MTTATQATNGSEQRSSSVKSPVKQYITTQKLPCGCIIRGTLPNLLDPKSIDYCATHKAAPALLKALRDLLPRAIRGYQCRPLEHARCGKCYACRAEAVLAQAGAR